MVLVKINSPVHYHVKKYRICKNKICQIPGTFVDGNMVVSAGMAHMRPYVPVNLAGYSAMIRVVTVDNAHCVVR